MDGFHSVLLTFHGELRDGFYLLKNSVTETVFLKVFQRDNLGSRTSSYVSIFQNRRTQWSSLRQVD